MDKKKAKILYVIKENKNLTKLDIKNKTGFSMTTVLNAVKKLENEGVITCGTRKTILGGKMPSVINLNNKVNVLGLGYSNGTLQATVLNLSGNIIDFSEEKLPENQDNLNKLLTRLTKKYSPVATGIITQNIDYEYCSDSLDNCKKKSSKLPEGLSCFYRFFNIHTNTNMVVLYIDDEISLMKSGETSMYCDISNLISPIINLSKGRLTYNDVLSKKVVEKNLKEKFHLDISQLKNLDDFVDNDSLFSYINRLNLALIELVTTIDKLINPEYVIIGGYLPQTVTNFKNARLNCKLLFAGDVSSVIGHCAVALALNSLYYYD